MSRIYFNAKVKAFSGEGVRKNRIMIDDDDAVRVYDSVAGYYTTCHALSARTVARLVRQARKADNPLTRTTQKSLDN